ncbi:DUF2569 domain-containing protein [Taklimakanibacter lacteus]|uniref:DUF2569 domain-containing protein n=1 Tax=Taklimakanibacter lacteus TaxID=2268456 RepID=UPI000E6751E3
MATPADSAAASDTAKPAEGPRGIGGWLILPIIHLVITILLTAYNVMMALQYWSGIMAMVTGNIDPAYRWMAVPTILSLVLGIALVAFAIYVLVRLFQKRREVPRLMIWFYSLVLAVTLFESGMVFAFEEFRESSADVGQALKDLIRAFLGVAIWIPYFLVSKRVKATFVE